MGSTAKPAPPTAATASAVPNPKFAECSRRYVYAFATAIIFQKRARKYRRLVQVLTFFGMAIPGVVGGIVLASLLHANLLEGLIFIAGALGVVQLVFSIWSVVANWPENLEYSATAGAANIHLSNKLKALADQAASPPADFDVMYTELIAMDEAQNDLDNRRDITDAEKMYGHRAALRQFSLKCTACGEVPVSMKMAFFSWNRCPVCGGPKKK
jgi:mobilome CxxCx(11)CxxC protein